MICREVTNGKGEDFLLTPDEEKYIRALERLSKMKRGRIRLFANGVLSVRINDSWSEDEIDGYVNQSILCEGGDGGDSKPKQNYGRF